MTEEIVLSFFVLPNCAAYFLRACSVAWILSFQARRYLISLFLNLTICSTQMTFKLCGYCSAEISAAKAWGSRAAVNVHLSGLYWLRRMKRALEYATSSSPFGFDLYCRLKSIGRGSFVLTITNLGLGCRFLTFHNLPPPSLGQQSRGRKLRTPFPLDQKSRRAGTSLAWKITLWAYR